VEIDRNLCRGGPVSLGNRNCSPRASSSANALAVSVPEAAATANGSHLGSYLDDQIRHRDHPAPEGYKPATNGLGMVRQ